MESQLFNPCLQNVQQSVEKSLKALLIENSIKLLKSHNISELNNKLSDNGFKVNIRQEDCELLDSIYLPTKYPLGSILPYFEPDLDICKQAIIIADNVFDYVCFILKK